MMDSEDVRRRADQIMRSMPSMPMEPGGKILQADNNATVVVMAINGLTSAVLLLAEVEADR